METNLFLKFMRSIDDIHSQGGKFVTNKVSNQQEPESDPQVEKLEKVISAAVRDSQTEWRRHLFWIRLCQRRYYDML
jgi:hypothetical protein